MKATTLRTLVGATTPLILTGSVQAGFLGISTVSKPNQFGLLVVNVYAEFDRPGEDYMGAIAGTPNSPLLIQVIGGTFYNHPFGTDRPPQCSPLQECQTFPSFLFDSFVTIGVKAVDPNGQPVDNMVITPGFPGVSGTSLATTTSGWAVTPIDPQADPFNPEYFAGDGRVLIGQFSTADGSAIQGTFLTRLTSNGVVQQHIVSFFHVPGPGALWLLGAAGLLGTRRRP